MNETKPLEFTKEQKLILWMLCEIHSALKIKNGIDPKLVEKAVLTGNTWVLDQEYNLDGAVPIEEEKVEFVCDVLDMYSILNSSYSELEQDEKDSLVELSSVKRNKEPAIPFPGFDGNNESQYRSVTFMMKTAGMYDYVDNITANSHRRIVPQYRNMLSVFHKINAESSNSDVLTSEGIKAVLAVS